MSSCRSRILGGRRGRGELGRRRAEAEGRGASDYPIDVDECYHGRLHEIGNRRGTGWTLLNPTVGGPALSGDQPPVNQ